MPVQLLAIDTLAILLLEAGPDYPDPEALPEDLADGHKNSVKAHDWGFTYVPGNPNDAPLSLLKYETTVSRAERLSVSTARAVPGATRV